MTTTPNPTDLHVGRKLRAARLAREMSHNRLGERLGITFQQVQKYENGSNRISASRLFDISRELDVPIQCFFEGVGESAPAEQVTA